ncbi:hypothetical protein PENTCL1PPCAC_13169, partial [Pristionchus entomophagus]
QKEEKMSNLPAPKHKSSFTITVPIDQLQNGQTKISPLHRVDGLNWRLHITRHELYGPDSYTLTNYIECYGDDALE